MSCSDPIGLVTGPWCLCACTSLS